MTYIILLQINLQFKPSSLTEQKLLCLIVFSMEFRDEANEGESHDGHQAELPGDPEHEDEVAGALDGAPQEDVDILGDEVTHLGGVS